jgi:hypothetical protein
VCGIRAPKRFQANDTVSIVTIDEAERSGFLPVGRGEIDTYGVFSGKACILVDRAWTQLRTNYKRTRPEPLPTRRMQFLANALGLAAGSGALPALSWHTTLESCPLFPGCHSWTGHYGSEFGDYTLDVDDGVVAKFVEFLDLLPRLGDRATRPLSWFSPAAQLQYIKEDEALVYAAIAYEGLIAPEKGAITLRFRQRGAYLMGDDFQQRLDWFGFFGDLYEARSELVHGNELPDPKKRAELVRRAVTSFPEFVRRLAYSGLSEGNQSDWNRIILGEPIKRGP